MNLRKLDNFLSFAVAVFFLFTLFIQLRYLRASVETNTIVVEQVDQNVFPGINNGDTILAVDKQPRTNATLLQFVLKNRENKNPVFTIMHNNEIKEVVVHIPQDYKSSEDNRLVLKDVQVKKISPRTFKETFLVVIYCLIVVLCGLRKKSGFLLAILILFYEIGILFSRPVLLTSSKNVVILFLIGIMLICVFLMRSSIEVFSRKILRRLAH